VYQRLGEAGAVERAAQDVVLGEVVHALLGTPPVAQVPDGMPAGEGGERQHQPGHGQRDAAVFGVDAGLGARLVDVDLDHAGHPTAVLHRHVGLAVPGRATGLAGAALQLDEVAAAEHDALHVLVVLVVGDRRATGGRVRPVEIVGDEHLAAVAVEELEAEDLADGAQAPELLERLAGRALSGEQRIEARHGGRHHVGVAQGRGLGVPAQVVLREGACHGGEKGEGREQGDQPQQQHAPFLAPGGAFILHGGSRARVGAPHRRYRSAGRRIERRARAA